MKQVRKVLLRSSWFVDAAGHGVKGAVEVYQKDGVVVLPALYSSVQPEDIRAAMRSVYRKLGQAGKEALCKYVRNAQLDAESEVLAMVEDIFGPMVREQLGSERGRGLGGKGVGRKRRDGH